MENSIPFELFRYQILPIDRFIQMNYLTEVSSMNELISRKNEFFFECIKETKDFSDNKRETITKKIHEDSEFILLKVAHNKSIRRETKDFRDEVIDSWPSILVAIWNDPEKQIIAVQKRTMAFSTCRSVVKMVLGAISKKLTFYGLTAIHEPLFEKQKFWSLLHKYDGKVKAVEFEMITPNMANISDSLADGLKDFAKNTNSTRNKLKLESDPGAPLHLSQDNEVLTGLVNYSSEGGGNISLKIEGVKKKYNTSKTVREVHLGPTEIQGSSDQITKVLKELMK
ncbi:hypothetical protein [uncultured Desulfuromonas sp.]|uniref:hypothetical protein n=1 Tax=uncultured Desulfuromonas sp. TaxID=181013 RepID=UPI002AAB9CED|nr:hypothetical protein [uncultured Desulfuromonas sp.]